MAQVSIPKNTTSTPIQHPTSTAALRASLGLPVDQASDDVWARRFAAGTHTMDQAQQAIQNKANEMGVKPPQPVPFQPSFDFDPQYNAGMNQINQQRSQFQADHNSQLQRITEDASRARDDMNRWRDDSLKANTEGMADRGLVHSGINIQKQSDIGEEFTRFEDQISLAQARGQEDLARFLAQQMNHLQGLQGQLEQMRAENQAMIERERAMHEAINRTPQPTASGRYDLNAILGDDRANTVAGSIENMFNQYGVPLTQHRTSSHETDAQRIQRITQEVLSGQRSMNDVQNSIAGISTQTNGVQQQIANMFQQAGVPLSQGALAGETEAQRIQRITNEVMSGQRTLASVQTSVNRLAGK